MKTINCITEIVQLLQDFLRSSQGDWLWIVDESVYADGGIDRFQAEFSSCGADLLATEVRTSVENPSWYWWHSLKPIGNCESDTHLAAFLALWRLSRPAAEVILCGIDAGWTGHAEVLIPTLLHQSGMRIEDIGGRGSFTPPERRGLWYDERTWKWSGSIEYVPGNLHFPVGNQTVPLAAGRIAFPKNVQVETPRILYVSPVGGSAAELLPEVLECFLEAGADCILMQYDDSDLEVPIGVNIVRDRGYKFQLALRHLHPDKVEAYDFIYFWDDDLRVTNFDPLGFAEIMRINHLDMAQPEVSSSYGLSHSITKPHKLGSPVRSPDGKTTYSIVGRLTNFVEIMAPVFTRDAWRTFYGYLVPENCSGWGYDYVPMGRKGIVDLMTVEHTRPVQSITIQSMGELESFLRSQGLFQHPPVAEGFLYDFVAFEKPTIR